MGVTAVETKASHRKSWILSETFNVALLLVLAVVQKIESLAAFLVLIVLALLTGLCSS